MRKELIETEVIENYLLNRLSPPDRQEFETEMLIDPSLSENTEAQAGVYKFVRKFWRRHTRRKLSDIYHQLMQETAFVQQLP
jgi:hypothetical protein